MWWSFRKLRGWQILSLIFRGLSSSSTDLGQMFVLGFCLLWVETVCGALSSLSAQAPRAWALKSWQYFRNVMWSNSRDVILTRVNQPPPERLQVHSKMFCTCAGLCWCLWARVSVKNLEVHEKVGEFFRLRGRISLSAGNSLINLVRRRLLN